MINPVAIDKSKFTSLLVLLVLEWENKFSNGNKDAVKEAAKRFIGLVTKDILTSIVAPISMSSNPIYLLNKKTDTFTILNRTRERYVDEGYHAMVIHNGLTIPVHIDFTDQEDLDWAILHQNDLYGLIGEKLARDEKLTTLEAHIMLFPEWGFKGNMKALKSSFSNSAGETSMRKLFMKGGVNKRVSKSKPKRKK